MKKGILGLLVVLLGSALLTSCIDPSDNNSALLQNNIKIFVPFPDAQSVGINQADIPGFENGNGTNPTQVTITFSGGADSARTAGCTLSPADNSVISAPSLSATTTSLAIGTSIADSLLADLECAGAPADTYTADVNISFTAGGKNYTANTTLSVTK